MLGIKPYIIQKFEQDSYLVIGKDYTRISDLLPSINEDLVKKRFKGEVILDLLLSNGNNQSRFFKLKFNGLLLDTDSIEKIKHPPLSLLKTVNTFFQKHPEVLQNGVLSTSEIQRLIITS